MKQSIGSQPGRPINAIFQWLSVFMTNSDHPIVHLAVANTGERREMAKSHHADTQSCHSPFVHLCLKSGANGVEVTFPRLIPCKWYILFLTCLSTSHGWLNYSMDNPILLLESIHLYLILLSGQSLSSPSSTHILIKKKQKFQVSILLSELSYLSMRNFKDC